jgi:hypothetical protein
VSPISPIITPLSPAGAAPVAAPRQGPQDASARKFAALMDVVPETTAVEPGRPSSLAQALLQDEGLRGLDRTLASTGEGPTDGDGEGTRSAPVTVQPMAFDMPFMFHLRA